MQFPFDFCVNYHRSFHMKKSLFPIGLLIAVIYACNQSDKQGNQLLSTGKLPSQVFSINITRDTTLLTKKGAIIHIPHGTLSASTNTVQLEIKEAYSMEDIIRASLTTQSNGQPLSSGGMIYINAVGENTVKVTQAISVGMPTDYLQKGMQLFKGQMQKDSTINWQDPQPLAPNKQFTAIELGEQIFISNCVSCHGIDTIFTGPPLAHANLLRMNEGLAVDKFIRNPAKVMDTVPYYKCLKDKYGGVMMTSFPSLTDEDLDNLFAYIKNESERLQIPKPEDWFQKCVDSCERYTDALDKIHTKRDSLIADNNAPRVEQRITPPPNTPGRVNLDSCTNCPPDKVVPQNFPAVYYQFKIEAFGWYNIDILLENVPGIINGQLAVRITGAYKDSFNIFLVIPALKAYQEGGLLAEKEDEYGFYKNDGEMPLLPGAGAWIFALGEANDEMYFGKMRITLRQQQNLQMKLEKVTREQFDNAIKAMNVNSMNIQVQQTKNADAIRKTDKELKEVEKIKPVNCNCDCLILNETVLNNYYATTPKRT